MRDAKLKSGKKKLNRNRYFRKQMGSLSVPVDAVYMQIFEQSSQGKSEELLEIYIYL